MLRRFCSKIVPFTSLSLSLSLSSDTIFLILYMAASFNSLFLSANTHHFSFSASTLFTESLSTFILSYHLTESLSTKVHYFSCHCITLIPLTEKLWGASQHSSLAYRQLSTNFGLHGILVDRENNAIMLWNSSFCRTLWKCWNSLPSEYFNRYGREEREWIVLN